jgi:serine/threonine protein kinase
LEVKILSTSFGLARNEDCESHDAFAVKSWEDTAIAVLADGAGSSRQALEASRRAVNSFVMNYKSRPRSWTPHQALGELTRLINRTLHQDSLARFGEPELITTLSIAVIEGDRLYGLNVGDSRVYLAHGNRLAQLSRDHVAGRPGLNHVLDKAIGLELDIEPHVFEVGVEDGDIALLCSDGVSNVLDEDLLLAKLSAGDAARSIVCSARELSKSETRDDVSAIVLNIQETSKLQTEKQLPLKIPESLRKQDIIEGFTLVKPFQHNARVWLATRNNQRFTLKFAPVEARGNEETLTLFIKEIWNATRLREPRFFPAAFVPERATTRLYALEFIDAPSLKMLLRSRRLAVDEAIALGKFLLAAAQHLLQFNLVHGDIKPDNILVISGYDTNHFKLIDFGSVTEVFSITSRAGTASYLAPERFTGGAISERTELFAIGTTLFEALTNALPFGEIERYQTPSFRAIKRPVSFNPNLPPWLESVLLRATSPDPELRYQNYSEMLFELEHPNRVAPFHAKGSALLTRDPLRFYRTGFYLLLIITLALLICLLSR